MSPPTPNPKAPLGSAPGASADANSRDIRLPDPAHLALSMSDVAARSQRLVNDWLKRQAKEGIALDPLNVGGAFLEMTAKLMANPSQLVQAQLGLWQDYLTLWQNTTRRIMGIETTPLIESDPRDKRFTDSAWKQNEIFDFIKQSYLLSARYIQDTVTSCRRPVAKNQRKKSISTARQFINALSPSNFVLTNPEVLRKTAGDPAVKTWSAACNNLLGRSGTAAAASCASK